MRSTTRWPVGAARAPWPPRGHRLQSLQTMIRRLGLQSQARYMRALSTTTLKDLLGPFEAGEGNWIVKDMSAATVEDCKALNQAIKEEISKPAEERSFYKELPYVNIEFRFGKNRFLPHDLECVKEKFLADLTTNGEPLLFTGEEHRFPNRVYLTGNTLEIAECWLDTRENEWTNEDLKNSPELIQRFRAACQRGFD